MLEYKYIQDGLKAFEGEAAELSKDGWRILLVLPGRFPLERQVTLVRERCEVKVTPRGSIKKYYKR